MIELLLEAERALSFGLVDRAEQLYRQVADADPHNSIAVVGLARVTLERGDDLGAYLLARRALTIDPENEAARRLASRLEEVLATRGEPVADPMGSTGRELSGPAAIPVATAGPATHPAAAADPAAFPDPAPTADDRGPMPESTEAPSQPTPPAPAAVRRSALDRLFRRR